MEIKPEDLLITSWSSRPSSGWSRHMDKGVKITHIPTGYACACDSQRSQHLNKALAMEALKGQLKGLGYE